MQYCPCRLVCVTTIGVCVFRATASVVALFYFEGTLMKFTLDYSDGELKKEEGRSRAETIRAVNALIRYYTDTFLWERQATFFGSFMYLNIFAKEQRGVWKYEWNETENTEGFRLVAKNFSFAKDGFADNALLGALEHFDSLQLKSEDGRVVILGTRSPKKE